MGTLQLSELRAEVTAHLAGRTDVTSAEINRAINLTQTRMARRHDFKELSLYQTGVLPFTGTPATDLTVAHTVFTSKTIDDIISFVIHDGGSREQKLQGWAPRQFDKRVPASILEDVDMPRHYVHWAERFELFPIPDQQYSFIFRAYVRPDLLNGDTSKSDLDDKDDLIIFLTTAYLYARLGEFDRANYFFGIYKDELGASIMDDLDKPDRDIKARHANSDGIGFQEYWNDPFVKSVR